MTNLLNTNQSRIFYVNPSEQVSTNLVDVEVAYNEVPDAVNLIQQNVQAMVNNGVFIYAPVTINNIPENASVANSTHENDDREVSIDVSLNPELNLEVSLFRRFLESAPSVAIQTIVIYMLMSTLPYVNKAGEADNNVVRVECLKNVGDHSDSYYQAQLLRGTTVVNQLVADKHLTQSDLDDAMMVVNDNGTVDLELENGNDDVFIFNLVGYYNAHNGEKVPKASQSICR